MPRPLRHLRPLRPLRPLLLAVLVVCVALVALRPLPAHGQEIDAANPGRVGLNTDGNVEIRPPAGKSVIISGTDFQALLDRVTALEAANGIRATDETVPNAGVTVKGDSAYIFGKNVYLGSPTTTTVTEQSTGWSAEVVRVSVGDTLAFSWTSSESVYEVNPADNTTAAASGVSSGTPVQPGSFSHQFLTEGTFRFRAANKGFLLTAVVTGFGVSSSSYRQAAAFLDQALTPGVEYVTGMAYESSYSSSCTPLVCPASTGIYQRMSCVRCSGSLNPTFGFKSIGRITEPAGSSSSYNFYTCSTPNSRVIKLFPRQFGTTTTTIVDDYACLTKLVP